MGTNKNIALAPDLFDQVDRVAQAEGRTADDIASEAVRRELTRRSLQAFVDRNRRENEQLGLNEGDVPRLVSDYRQQQRVSVA
jgi:predicted transcriptional regulator